MEGETTLGELLDATEGSIKTGPFGTKLKASEYTDNGVPVISVGEVGYGRLRIRKETPRVNQSVWNRMPEFLLRAGDIVFGRKGAVDRSAQIQPNEDGFFLGSDGIRVRLNSDACDPKFIAYQLQTPAHRDWMIQHAAGSTMPSLNEGIIRRIPIVLKPLPEQMAIAAVLGTLDDKIELNRRMNATLEAMARALFQSWFVDFDPVRAKAEGRAPAGLDERTAALFPTQFQNSELSEIPQEWRVGTLGEVATNPRRGVDTDEINGATAYIGLEHMPRRCTALSEWDTAEDLESNKSEFKRGEILFGKLRPYFHKVGVAPLDGVCSTDILVISPATADWFGFVLGHVSSLELVNHSDAMSTGTRMPRTKWQDIAAFQVALPSKEIAAAFTAFVNPLAQQIIANIHQSRALAALRDTLLPKLLSGELSSNPISE